MLLKNKRIVLTGAAGGMGELLAWELSERGARLILTDLNEQRVVQLAKDMGDKHVGVGADLCAAEGREALLNACQNFGGVDILINAAGMSEFALLENQSPEKLELMTRINLIAPMQLCQSLLPLLSKSSEAAIVNIGSTFGAIGHPGFAAYCATKAGLRGFTQALRRELADTSMKVFYIAPRAVQTDMNSEAVVELNRELGNTMDKPELVVSSMLGLLSSKPGGDYFLGWPEKLFVRVNALIPGVVDSALGKQLSTIKRLAV